MIIIAGIKSEEPVSMVIDSAVKAGIEYFIFNQRDAHHYDINFLAGKKDKGAWLYASGQTIDLNKIEGVYFRMMDSSILPENLNRSRFGLDHASRTRMIFINEVFSNICDILPCRVLNRPNKMNSNFSKIYQLKFIRDAGLKIPPTLVTNDKESVSKMLREHPNLIFKSLSSTRSIVKPLDNSHLRRMDLLKFLPTQFQQCLDGFNVRVHVVGDVLFAMQIISKSIDYRYSSRDGNDVELVPYDLPSDIKKKCFELSASLSLPLCGIDLFMTKDDNFYCFEVNPSPGYSFFQQSSSTEISDAIVKYLQNGTAR
jgi:hypothetical protein